MRDLRKAIPALPAMLLVCAACSLTDLVDPGDDGGGDPPDATVLALHSVGQTMQGYEVREGEVTAFGLSIGLGGLFDGNGMDLLGSVAVTSESSFGGDRALIVDLPTGTVAGVGFGEEGVNPSKPFAAAAPPTAFIAGRGTNAIYRISLATVTLPAIFASGAGEFIEKVVATNDRVFAIDSNIDDVGGTFEPLGNSRVKVFDLDGAAVDDLDTGGFQAIDGVLAAGRIVVLNAGSLTPTFEPEGNGSLALVDPSTLQVSGPFPLGGNGVSLENGADGLVYVSVTSDFVNIRTLRFNPASGSFINGPESPIPTHDSFGVDVPCWVATAIADGRLLCATFRSDQSGELLLLEADGSFIDSTAGGFGTTDLEIVTP